MALRTTVTRQAPRALLALCGRLEGDAARVVRLKAQSLLATGHSHLLLDLAGVSALDEAGVWVIRHVHRIYSLAGGRLILLGLDLDTEACLLAHGADDVLVASATDAA